MGTEVPTPSQTVQASDRMAQLTAGRSPRDVEVLTMRRQGLKAGWTAESLALYTQATIQGAFILAKARHSPEVAAACIDHLRRYIELLFTHPQPKEETA